MYTPAVIHSDPWPFDSGDGLVTEKEFYFGLVAAAPTLWQCGKNFFDALDVDHVNLIKENHIKTIYSDMDKNGRLNTSLITLLYRHSILVATIIIKRLSKYKYFWYDVYVVDT